MSNTRQLDPQLECDSIASELKNPNLSINDFVRLAAANSRCKGWPESSPIERLALVHCEVSEAVEEIRDGRPVDLLYFKGEKPEGVPAEMADIVIRVFDFAGREGIDLEAAIRTKMLYNTTRPTRHGGKLL